MIWIVETSKFWRLFGFRVLQVVLPELNTCKIWSLTRFSGIKIWRFVKLRLGKFYNLYEVMISRFAQFGDLVTLETCKLLETYKL